MNIVCPYCRDKARLVKGEIVYPHRPELKENLYYRCAPCNAHVGCHPGTDKPLGELANFSLRQWRMKAHSVFDPLWKQDDMLRSEAYAWMRKVLDISEEEAHIGKFDISRCAQLIKAARERRESRGR